MNWRIALFLLAFLTAPKVMAATVTVAVASNFTPVVKELGDMFERESGHRLRVSSASTGKLYAQIHHGAPYDIFIAADAIRPQLLVAEGLAVADSLKSYAIGRLVLWGPGNRFVGKGEELLQSGQFRHLAIANPLTAPYGAAAKEALQKMGLWSDVKARLVRGENIGQTYQYVASGAAELGLVARAQVNSGSGGSLNTGFFWLIPKVLHQPIEQQLVLLKRAEDNLAAQQFLTFLTAPATEKLIRSAGYDLPGSS